MLLIDDLIQGVPIGPLSSVNATKKQSSPTTKLLDDNLC